MAALGSGIDVSALSITYTGAYTDYGMVTMSDGARYRLLAFTSSGTLSIEQPVNCKVCVVGGGANGTNGGNGHSQGSNKVSKPSGGAGGSYGGGAGGSWDSSAGKGGNATYYGSGAGGGNNYANGGSGYQGIVYMRIPEEQAA